MSGLFERVTVDEDHVRIDDFVLYFETTEWDNRALPPDRLSLHKGKWFIKKYAEFFTTRPLETVNIFEIGIWDGGSTAFWFEVFRPHKLVAIDLSDRGDSEFFKDYVASRKLEERIRTYWQVDQADSQRLREIVDEEFGAPLDLVVDDGSHMYAETRASFSTLFPLLRPKGIYVIEDWNWEYQQQFQEPSHPFAGKQGLVKLTFELVATVAKDHMGPRIVSAVSVFPGFIAVERGWGKVDDAQQYELERFDLKTLMPGHPAARAAVHGTRAGLGAGRRVRWRW